MTQTGSHPPLASHTERAIAAARVMLAASSLFAVWLDPTEPSRYVGLAYTLQAVYLAYSLGLAALMWNHSGTGRLPAITHAADIVLCSVFQYLTLGPSSPFFLYFTFSVFCGALRWGWQGTLVTSIVVMFSYLAMAAWMSRELGPTEFGLNRFIIRAVYLAVVGALLVYLGQHEVRLRAKIERLARWPMGSADVDDTLVRVLEYAGQTLGAGRVLVAWDNGDEPWLYVAAWPAAPFLVTKHPPAELEPLVPEALTDSVLFSVAPITESAVLAVRGTTSVHWPGAPAHPAVLSRLGGVGLASAPFRTERVSGRAFFSDLGTPTAESPVLTQVVARAIGESIDRLQSSQQLLEIGAREQRILLARDLHDGVLQSLTGIRFELQRVARTLSTESPETSAERLLATERSLAIEQRELRHFIDGLKPTPALASGTALTARLQALRERVSLEWKVPITIRVGQQTAPLPATLEEALPFMAHEAIVNALKHAHPSRVSVDVDGADGLLRLVVIDDGCGFPFRGRYPHARLREVPHCPVSLFERTSALGGQMNIESTDTGSRVEFAFPVPVAAA